MSCKTEAAIVCLTAIGIACLWRSCDVLPLVPIVGAVAALGGYHLKK